ncbi:MAG: ATP-grasp domain-containing protein [Promethearchaeota archaeon]
MKLKRRSVLVTGFNVRPLAYSLSKAGYLVYAVDFFGDLDLFPYVEDSLIVLKNLDSSYEFVKEDYAKYLTDFTLKLLKKKSHIDFILLGSGFDNSFDERRQIINEIKNPRSNINNSTSVFEVARDIETIFKILMKNGYNYPQSITLDNYINGNLNYAYPFILKRKKSSGGVSVFKIENENKLNYHLKLIEHTYSHLNEWLIQEYLEGIPVSCTIISNGKESDVVSINRQIIGERLLNSPKEFMYCGNVVPADLLSSHSEKIIKISLFLAKKLGLKGLNGFDYVVKNGEPFLMEINPRIPGSIRASETAYDLNLLDLHIKSFDQNSWNEISAIITNKAQKCFATKLILFAPKIVPPQILRKINEIKYIHDKSEPTKELSKGEPICTILFKGKNFSDSYFGALKVAEKINSLIK